MVHLLEIFKLWIPNCILKYFPILLIILFRLTMYFSNVTYLIIALSKLKLGDT